jgi:hypothetical protein
MPNSLKHELLAVISGKSPVRCGAAVQAAASHLGAGPQTGRAAQDLKQVKGQESALLTAFAQNHGLWIEDIDVSKYVSEGAEQKVYLQGHGHVLKLNDAIYFETWREYLHNLLLHNFFFPDTAYELIGFTDIEGVLHGVVRQPYVVSTEPTDLSKVREFLEQNGFRHIRNNDYAHPDWGVILEDLHDENVLTQNGTLYFIDTVFYLTEQFWDSP